MKKMLTTLAAVLCCAAVFTSCEPDWEPIEYGKVFTYTYEGQTLYYVIDEESQAATAVVPCYPNYPDLEEDLGVFWKGYEKPKGKVVIPGTVEYSGKSFPLTALGWGLFLDCGDITSVSLPEGITTIPGVAFAYCSSLTDIHFPSTLTKIEGYAFQYDGKLGPDIVLPEGLTEIGDTAFGDCTSIETIVLPSSLRSIGSAALDMCTKLKEVTFPDQLTQIGHAVLQLCTSLTTCHLPAQLENISAYLFYGCKNLTTVNIPEGITSIGEAALFHCDSLASIVLPNSIQSIGDYAFSYTRITEVTFPDQMTHLGEGVLKGCTMLTKCHLPAKLEYIDTYALGKCLSLRELSMPAGLTAIADSVFVGGTKLESLTLSCSVPPSARQNTFEDYSTAIIVPKGAGDAYRRDEIWGRFANITEK